jgi:hypothetical protein
MRSISLSSGVVAMGAGALLGEVYDALDDVDELDQEALL